jgi:hypothetical protein
MLMGMGIPEIVVLLAIGGFAFWVTMLIEAATKETDPNDRLIWVLIIVLTTIIGALIYFFVRRPVRRRAEFDAVRRDLLARSGRA